MVDDSGAFRSWNGDGVVAWIVVPFAIGAETMMHDTDKVHLAIQVILKTMVLCGMMDSLFHDWSQDDRNWDKDKSTCHGQSSHNPHKTS